MEVNCFRYMWLFLRERFWRGLNKSCGTSLAQGPWLRRRRESRGAGAPRRSETGEVLLRGVGTVRYSLILGDDSACQVPICAVSAWWFDNPRQKVVPRRFLGAPPISLRRVRLRRRRRLQGSGVQGCVCFEDVGFEQKVHRPSATAGVGTSHLKLVWAMGLEQLK